MLTISGGIMTCISKNRNAGTRRYFFPTEKQGYTYIFIISLAKHLLFYCLFFSEVLPACPCISTGGQYVLDTNGSKPYIH
jgi:hypothetical protein